jgi:hypothetical protein
MAEFCIAFGRKSGLAELLVVCVDQNGAADHIAVATVEKGASISVHHSASSYDYDRRHIR